MSVCTKIDAKKSQVEGLGNVLCWRLGSLTHTSLYGVLFLCLLCSPDILFAKSLDTEFIERMVILPVTQPSQIVRARAVMDRSQASARTLFDVYLDEDRPLVREEVLRVLEQSVEFLQPDQKRGLSIETYCDRRSSSAYNLVLGHRRGKQILELVQSLGIEPSQIHSMSYGSKLPQCRPASNSCWEEHVRTQLTFRYLAISEPKLGCLGRLRLHGTNLQLTKNRLGEFLQKIQLSPTRARKSPTLSSFSHHSVIGQSAIQ